jgi:peptidoglycan-N-acetylglucosamine deacetylase
MALRMRDPRRSRSNRKTFASLLVFACALASATNSSAEKVAITFDDLPRNGELVAGIDEAAVAKRTLAILKSRKTPQVFGFINAAKLEDNPAGKKALRLWVAAGERLGNHTYSHRDLHRTDVEDFIADVERNEASLQSLSAKAQWHWFRYPFLREGDTLEKRRDVHAYLAKRGYTVAQVTLDYEDYLWNTPYARCAARNDVKSIEWLKQSYLRTASDYIDADRQMAQRVFGRSVDHVLLLHLGAFSETILPSLLDLLREKGFTLATIEEVQADSIYRTDPDAPSRYGGTLLEQWMDARNLKYPQVAKKPTTELDAVCK